VSNRVERLAQVQLDGDERWQVKVWASSVELDGGAQCVRLGVTTTSSYKAALRKVQQWCCQRVAPLLDSREYNALNHFGEMRDERNGTVRAWL
jgi:hypothetical protein